MIESMQSLGMDNFRVAYTRFLAFYSDNPSGLQDGETPAKGQSKASISGPHVALKENSFKKIYRSEFLQCSFTFVIYLLKEV